MCICDSFSIIVCVCVCVFVFFFFSPFVVIIKREKKKGTSTAVCVDDPTIMLTCTAGETERQEEGGQHEVKRNIAAAGWAACIK